MSARLIPPNIPTCVHAAWQCVVALAMITVPSLRAEEPPALDQAWDQASSFLFNEAFKSFEKATASGSEALREQKLGEAVTLLSYQPRTQKNLMQAREMLERLVAEHSGDQAGILSRFMLGRVHEFHLDPPELGAARRLYRGLVEEHAGDIMAEQAAAALVMLELYENVTDDERVRRFAEMESWAGKLRTSLGRRQFHMNLGMGALDFRLGGERVVRHLVAADREGITRWQTECAVWVMIAENAAALGDRTLALEYYRKFVAKYQRDARYYLMSQKLRALEDSPETPLAP